MTELGDRLDWLARHATDGVDLLSPDLMVRARQRHRVRARLGLATAAFLAASGGVIGFIATSSSHNTVVHVGSAVSPSESNHVAPGPDVTLTPSGWSPLALGNVQISVPSSWFVEDPGIVCGGGAQGMVFIDEQPTVGGATDCALTPNVVSVAPSTSAGIPHAQTGVLNSIPVISGWSQTGSTKTVIVRALGYDVTASGPLADQVTRTLTYSPLSFVLNSDLTSTPSDWQPVTFGGMGFSVPAAWTVHRYSWWGGCPGNLPANTLELSTAQAISAPGCPPPLSTAGYDAGVPALIVGSGPAVTADPGARCIDRNGLHICIDAPPDPTGGYEPGHGLNILTAQVSIPGQATLDQIEIGLSGDGSTALAIFDSLRAALPTGVAGTLPRGTTTTLPSTAVGLDGIRSGYYVDGPAGRPHYVLTVTATATGLSGWLFFVYQDGHISEILHYHSTQVTADVLTALSMVTDRTSQPFPFDNPPGFGQAGSQPIPAGRAFNGVYGSSNKSPEAALTLSDCGAYLYWANPADLSEPVSCSFTYNGTSIG